VLDRSGRLTPLYTQERNPEHPIQKAGWTLGPVRPAAENLAPIGIRNLNRRYIDCDIPTTKMAATYKGKLFLVGKLTKKEKTEIMQM
jgi:hypothetical protein